MKQEISQAFTSEGIPGVEKLLQDTIKQNDRKWFLLFCLTAVIFGGWVSLHKCDNMQEDNQKVDEVKDSLLSRCLISS